MCFLSFQSHVVRSEYKGGTLAKVRVSPEVELHVEQRGQRDFTGTQSNALVLLNGMSQSTVNWMSQARRLSQDFFVVSYDARGQGRSPIGTEPLTLDVHVNDLCKVLDALEIPQAHLCGFSFGARLALGFAARRPSRVGKLVLTSSGAHEPGGGALRRMMVRSWSETLRLGGLEAMTWCALPYILGERFLRSHEAQMNNIVRTTLQRNSAEGLRAVLDGYLAFPPPEDDARVVRAPALLIGAGEDLLVPRASVERLSSLLANARHLFLEECGHTLPIENPEGWRQEVLEFLRT